MNPNRKQRRASAAQSKRKENQPKAERASFEERLLRLEQWAEKSAEANRQNFQGLGQAVLVNEAHLLAQTHATNHLSGLMGKTLDYETVYKELEQVKLHPKALLAWLNGTPVEDALKLIEVPPAAEAPAEEPPAVIERVFGGDYGEEANKVQATG